MPNYEGLLACTHCRHLGAIAGSHGCRATATTAAAGAPRLAQTILLLEAPTHAGSRPVGANAHSPG